MKIYCNHFYIRYAASKNEFCNLTILWDDRKLGGQTHEVRCSSIQLYNINCQLSIIAHVDFREMTQYKNNGMTTA